MTSIKRLQRELVQLMRDPIQGVGTVTQDQSNPFQWKAHILGPEGSPYENGIVEVELLFSENYPNRPPNIKFLDKFFHANVGTDGHLCLSLFQDWRTTDTVTTILLAISNLLSAPNRASAYQGGDLTEAQYLEKARQWTRDYGKMSS